MLLLLSSFSHVQLCVTPWTAAHLAPLSLGFSRQEHWSGLPFPSPMHASEKWKWSCSVVSDPQQPCGLQPTRLLCPWDFPGKNTGVGCHNPACTASIVPAHGNHSKGSCPWFLPYLLPTDQFWSFSMCPPPKPAGYAMPSVSKNLWRFLPHKHSFPSLCVLPHMIKINSKYYQNYESEC